LSSNSAVYSFSSFRNDLISAVNNSIDVYHKWEHFADREGDYLEVESGGSIIDLVGVNFKSHHPTLIVESEAQ